MSRAASAIVIFYFPHLFIRLAGCLPCLQYSMGIPTCQSPIFIFSKKYRPPLLLAPAFPLLRQAPGSFFKSWCIYYIYLYIIYYYIYTPRFFLKQGIDKSFFVAYNNSKRQDTATFGGDFVAEMEANGKIYGFNLTEKELNAAISRYKNHVATGEIPLPSWGHFCAFVGVSGKTLKKVIEQGLRRDAYEKSAYYGRAVALESFRDWCIGELLSNPNWGGKNANKAMKILAIEHGMQEAPAPKASGPGVCVVEFGGGDPRGKKAGK